MQEYLYNLIYPLAYGVLPFLVLVASLVFSFKNYRQNPQKARLAIIAIIMLLGLTLFPIFQSVLNIWMIKSEFDIRTISYIFAVFGVIFSIVRAIALGLLIYAVWSNRRE